MGACYSILDYNESTYYDTYDNSHIQVETIFKSGDAPVNVTSPSFVLTNAEGTVVTPTYLLQTLHREPTDSVGAYWGTFLTDGIPAGSYTITFTGTYNSEILTDTGTLVLTAVLQAQYLIDLLRTALGDYNNIALPRKYWTFPMQNRVWKDGELYQFLKLACEDLNAAIPFTQNAFSPSNVPVLSFPILGGQIYAFSAITSVETANFFNFSAGTVHVDLHKGDKYLGLARFMQERYFAPASAWKKWYVMSQIKHRVIARRRTPLRVARPISDTAHFHSLRGF